MADNPNNLFIDGFDWAANNQEDVTAFGAYGTYGSYVNNILSDLIFVTGRFGIGRAISMPYYVNAPNGFFYGRSSITKCVLGCAVRHNTTNLDEYRRVLAVAQGDDIGPQMLIDTLGRICVAVGSTVHILHSQPLGVSSWHYVEMDYYVHASDGYVRLILNGKEVGRVTSIDTRGGITTTPDGVHFGNFRGSYLLPAASRDGTGIIIDDFYMMDATGIGSNLGPMTVETFVPTSENSNTGWAASSGTTYGAVDDPITSATTPNIEADTVGDIILFDSTGQLTINPVTVHGVQVKYFGNKSDAGTRLVSAALKPTTTVRVADVEDAPADTNSFLHHLWTKDPDDLSDWNKAKIEATAFGIKITT